MISGALFALTLSRVLSIPTHRGVFPYPPTRNLVFHLVDLTLDPVHALSYSLKLILYTLDLIGEMLLLLLSL